MSRKNSLIFVISLGLLLLFPVNNKAFAQNIQSVQTAVGNPATGGGLAGKVYFYCQYGGVNSSGKLNSPNSWNIPSGHSFYGGSAPTANQCDISGNGCGPTSIAMIMSTLGVNKNPTETALGGQNNGCGGAYGGTSAYDVEAYFTPFLRSNGFTITGNLVNNKTLNTDSVKRFLDSGYLILGGANMKYMTNSGYHLGLHAFVISGYNGTTTNDFTVYDPTFCENGVAGGQRPLLDVNNSSTSGDNNVDYWLYAFAIKKQ